MCISLLSQSYGQIRGNVFRDFNANGTQDISATFTEVGVGSVVVRASDGTTSATTTTDASGDYAFPNAGVTASGKQVRIEFSGLAAGDFSAPRGPASGTSVQFITAGSDARASLGINYPAQYCQDAPFVTTSCFVSGNPLPGSQVGAREALVSIRFAATGTPPHFNLAIAEEVGSVGGLAYQREGSILYSAAFTKRHVGYGPGGPGAVYATRVTGNQQATSATTQFFNFGSTAGTDLHDPDLPTTSSSLVSRENNVFDAVGKVGLGDIDISDDEKSLYVVNLFNRKLYKLDIATRDTVGYLIPNPGCPGGSYRPFAVKYYRGKVYVGVVCSQEGATSKTDTAGMAATVYQFNGTTFQPVLSFPLTYKKQPTNADKVGVERSEYWRPWSATLRTDRDEILVTYPQPWLTDIEFDINGDMILGVRDRFGDQMGYGNYKPFTTSTETFNAITPGEILRAGKCTEAELWTIEANGAVCGGTPSAAQAAQEGPGGGKYYVGDQVAEGGNHGLSSMGTLALYAGSGKVIMTAIDPIDDLYQGGVKRLINRDGTVDAGGGPNGGATLYTSGAFAYGKANGLGDLELLCRAAPIEIGNRVWFDQNENGIQDPGEPGLEGIDVTLYLASAPTVPLAVAVTDANGNYSFSSGEGTSTSAARYGLTILSSTNYRLAYPTAASGRSLVASNVGANDLIDSDAPTDGIVSFKTGVPGESNHSFDVGYATCVAPVASIAPGTQTICVGEKAPAFTVTPSAGVQYQWYGPLADTTSGLGTAIAGATTGTFTPTGAQIPTSGKRYFAVVVNSAGSTTCVDTAFAALEVNPDCVIPKGTYDLALDKSVDKKVAMLGDTLTFLIKVWNEGQETVNAIEVTDSLNAGTQYLSSTATRGTYAFDTRKWTIGSLARGDTVRLAIKVRVVAQGVWFNTAEITNMTEKDEDSTPANGVESEDDIDRECFTVPVRICRGQGVSVGLAVPAMYTGVVWFRKTQNGQPVQVGTGNTYSASETEPGSYEYTFTSTSGSCPAEGCCPTLLVVEDCCPVQPCVPFVITKKPK